MWGPLVSSEIQTNGVIMVSNPYFQFLQPNTGRVHSNPKIRDATKHWTGWLRPKNWVGSNPTHPTSNHRYGENFPRTNKSQNIPSHPNNISQIMLSVYNCIFIYA